MKKYCYFIAGTAFLAMASSCTSDLEVSENGPNRRVEVTFSAKLPSSIGSRAVSDGTTANRLSYAAYLIDGSSATLAASDVITDAFNGSLTEENVTLSLLSGETYKVVFWADYANGTDVYYTFDTSTATVSATWASDKTLANDEHRDAFYAVDEITVSASESKTVELYRPFAQINFGSSDVITSGLGIDLSQTKITIDAGVYQNFHILTDVLDGATSAPLTYDLNARPAGDNKKITVNSTAYEYIAYTYLFAKDEVLNKVTLTTKTGQSRDIPNVPVKRNYKTNIVGNLFTSAVKYNIVIKPEYETPDNDILVVWDGTTKTPVTPVAENIGGKDVKVYTVTTPSELAWVASDPTATSAADTYISLENNMDMGNNVFPGFGTSSRKDTDQSKMFSGTFNGNGHIIENVKLQSTGDKNVTALIATAKDATITNVKMNNVVSEADDTAAPLVGYTCGDLVTISDCVITDVKIISEDTGGGLVGKAYAEKTIVKNCKVSGNITGQKAGGIIGHSPYAQDKAIEIINCENNANITTSAIAGGICGMSGTKTTISNCVNNGNITGVTYTASMIGYYSITGAPSTHESLIENNENYGSLKCDGVLRTMVAYISTGGSVVFANNKNFGKLSKAADEYNNHVGASTVTSTGYTNNGTVDSTL